MITLEIGDCKLDTKCGVVYALRDIAYAIEQGYTSGCAVYGVCWSIIGNDEEDDEC